MRVLAVDPGLTRCGVAVVDGGPGTALVMRHCGVLRTDADLPIAQRLYHLDIALRRLLQEHEPAAVVVERVFSQHNVRTAIATGQAAAVALLAAASSGLASAEHTPTEVKAAVTGSGRADKRQVATMVTRVLRLPAAPAPADATDALALAICHLWRVPMQQRIAARESVG
jgi:crossover junction endodeoxyribonuclease RuvC